MPTISENEAINIGLIDIPIMLWYDGYVTQWEKFPRFGPHRAALIYKPKVRKGARHGRE